MKDARGLGGTTRGAWGYALFLIWMSYLVAAAVVMFGRGFLLTRSSRTETARCQPYEELPCGPVEAALDGGSCTPKARLSSLLSDVNSSTRACLPKRARVVLVVIDALKYEFAAPTEDNIPKDEIPSYRNRLRTVAELMESSPDRARLFKFVADPPTTTLQRLKGMTTGSLPTFIDAGSNFATSEINEDNVIDQLTLRGGRAVLLGDDTWANLYPGRWIRSHAMPSFNAWDLDTVDDAVEARLYNEIAKDDWSLLVAHFLGVDHCGHRYGPEHPEMVRKLTQMDKVIADVVRILPNDTVLFVVGDHGMTKTGDHGGETEDEVNAAMFVYSPYKLFSPPDPLSPKTVRQVDFVPTLSSILGLPPPFSNLGAIIPNALPFSGSSHIPYQDWEFALLNLWANVKQVTNYIQQYSQTSDQFSIEKIEMIERKYDILSHRVKSIFNEKAFHSFSTDAMEFLVEVRSMCQEVWIQFDSFSMSRGLLLMFLTIFFSYMIVDGIPSGRLPEIFQSSFILCSYGAMALAALSSAVCYILNLVDNLELTILFSTGMISIVMFATLIIQNWEQIAQQWYENSKKNCWIDMVARLVIVLSAFALFSNSYIVEEGAVLSFLLLSLLLAAAFNSGVPKVVFPLYVCAGTLTATSRYYRTCREEQGECYYRNTEYNQMSPIHLLTGSTALVLFVTLTRRWLRSCGNLVASDAILWRYAPAVAAVCTGCYWVATWGPSRTTWKAESLARLVFGINAVTIIVLVIKPLSVFIIPKQGESVSVSGHADVIPQLFNQMKGLFNKQYVNSKKIDSRENMPIVCGLATVYSAAFVMLSVCVTVCVVLLLGAKLSPSIILFYFTGVFVLALLSLSRYHNSTSLVDLMSIDACAIQCWVLLSLYYFYGTGHQATLSSIRWSAAFVGTGGHFTYNIVPAVLVILNTFGSQLVAGLCVPLLVLAPFPIFVMWGQVERNSSKVDIQRGELILFEKNSILTTAMFNVSSKYILFHAIRMFLCMLAATIHCRHLMVWKVFAPKLIFEGIGLMVTLIGVLLGYLLVMRIHSRLNVFLDRVAKSS